ncbi:MAG: tRNA(Ile)-lysidine synthase [Paraglaciecola sp.]|jgi:tRNA(Ile)-lysidine synthase
MNLVAHLAKKLLLTSKNASAKFIVAYSGGLDSHVLLHAMASLREQFGFSLAAIHIHHGLSQNADLWQLHCEQVCSELAVPLQSARVKVQKASRQSLEALARELRYQKLTELAPQYSVVMLAQHQDDQLETVLLQLKRGAGPKGLAGMANQWSAVAKDDSLLTEYLRPMLDVSQKQILAYAKTHKLSWQEDESNQNIDFERNFLRHQVLPILTERWPELAGSVSRSARLCAQQQELLDEISLQKLSDLRSSNNSLDINKLLLLSDAWQLQVVRVWLAEQQIQSPSQAVLEQLKAELFEASDDANPIIRWQDWQFRRFYQQLYVLAISADLSGVTIPWDGQASIVLPQGLGQLVFQPCTDINIKPDIKPCLLDKNAGEINIRFGGYGDKFKPAGQANSKPLKQWFKVWKIPPWERNRIAIIVQNSLVKALLVDNKLLLAEEVVKTQQLALSSELEIICISKNP